MMEGAPCEVCTAFDANLRTWDGSLVRDESGHHPDCYRGNTLREAIRRARGPTVPECMPLAMHGDPARAARVYSGQAVEVFIGGERVAGVTDVEYSRAGDDAPAPPRDFTARLTIERARPVLARNRAERRRGRRPVAR
jgi:hypothetical protein